MPRNRGFSYGSVETQGRQGEIGNWAFGDVPETNVGNIARRDRKARVAHGRVSNRGFRGFWVGTSRMGADGGLWGFSWVLGASDYFARSL